MRVYINSYNVYGLATKKTKHNMALLSMTCTDDGVLKTNI